MTEGVALWISLLSTEEYTFLHTNPRLGPRIMLSDAAPMTTDTISTGFCAEMGAMEATCDALIGAGMIAGLKTEGSRTLIYTKQIVDEFKKYSGAVRCRDLKGIDAGKVLCPCDDCVRNAVRAYETVMTQYPG